MDKISCTQGIVRKKLIPITSYSTRNIVITNGLTKGTLHLIKIVRFVNRLLHSRIVTSPNNIF